MTITIAIPVFNEEAQLAASVHKLDQFLKQHSSWSGELVIADNGSTDRTCEIARELDHECARVRVCHLDQKGRGRALRAVWERSEADILAYMDVDLSTDLAAFPPMVEALASGQWDIGTGTRLHPRSVTRRCLKREILSRGYNWLLRASLRVPFSDAQCGFKAITRAAARSLLPLVEDNEWFFDTELLVIGQRLGYRIYEQPVTWTEDPGSSVKLWSAAWKDLRGIARLLRSRGRAVPGRLPAGRAAGAGGVCAADTKLSRVK